MIGIYCITNIKNGKKYIGQSWNIEKRWKEHAGAYRNSHISNAIKKYGIDNFKFDILRAFNSGALTQIFLDLFERKYIIENNTILRAYGYNKNTGGGSCGVVSEETKVKISKSNAGKQKPADSIQKYRDSTLKHHAKYGSPCTGIKKSEETKLKIRNALKGKPWSEKRRQACKITDEIRKKLKDSHTNLPWSELRWEAYYRRYGSKDSL